MITIEDMVQREVIHCVSGLYSDLQVLAHNASRETLDATNLDADELDKLDQRPDYEAAGDEHIDQMDRGELIEALDDAGVEDERHPTDKAIAAHEAWVAGVRAGDINPAEDGIDDWCQDNLDQWPGISADDLRARLKAHLGEYDEGYKDFCEEHNLDYDYIEVYEHWIVTNWLAGKLAGKGEITGDICGLTVWGRTTTGQAISMDWVIQEIYKETVA